MTYSRQRTFRRAFTVAGIGLHTGIVCSVDLKPATVGTGIFIRMLDGTPIPIADAHVIQTPRCTRLSDCMGNSVDTPEHLLAALAMVGIDNCIIEFSCNEVPILDGCASAWLHHFANAGIVELSARASVLEVTREFVFIEGDSRYVVVPGAARVTVDIHFSHLLIGHQRVDVDGAQFKSLASSRTFVLEREIARLHAAGLALGGSLDNAVVVGDTDVLNPGGFRFDNECARHKALDLIGDMYVLGAKVTGHVAAHRPSHAANAAFVSALKESGALRLVAPAMLEAA